MTPYERVLTVRMLDTDHDIIRLYAHRTRRSMNDIVTEALTEFFGARRDFTEEHERESMRQVCKDNLDRIGPIAAAVVYPDGKPDTS